MEQPTKLYSVLKIGPNGEKVWMTADANQAWSRVYDIQQEFEAKHPELKWIFDDAGFRDETGLYRAVFIELSKAQQ